MSKFNDYTAVAKVLHWLMAILIMAELGIAYLFLASETAILTPFQGALYYLHFNIGFSILILFIIRVFWRLTHKTPAYSKSFHKEEINFVHYGHVALYVLIGYMVLTGILRYNIHSGDFHYFDIITIPAIIHTHNQTLYSIIAISHNLCGTLLCAMVAVHIAMAVRHHLIDKNDIMFRMLPRFFRKD